VSVAPLSAILTTQNAADYLGISRPNLVRILERGEIPIEAWSSSVARLKDLGEYQGANGGAASRRLEQLVDDAEEGGLYERLDRPAPRTR